MRVLRKLRYGWVSRMPFRRSAGGSGTRFSGKLMIFANSFLRLWGVLETRREGFGRVWARYDAISPRSWPHFGAGPS